MSEKTAQPQPVMMTNVKGYFNPNPYRVNVSISELGISVQLEPQEFIVERISGKKVNDPILDRYVGYKMLSPDLANQPVPVIPLPRKPSAVPAQHVVSAGQRDGTGKWKLPPPGSQPAQSHVEVPPSVTKPSTVGMSLAEARRLGFVGKVKLVSEDYGAVETDGAPPRGDSIPRIKYSLESQAPLARAGALPQEIVESVRPDVAPILAGLQAAAQHDPEAVSLGRKSAEQAVAVQQGAQGVAAFRAEVKQAKVRRKIASVPSATIPSPQAPATPSPAPRRRIGQVVVQATPTAPVQIPMPVEAESPLIGSRSDLPAPVLEEAEQPSVAPGAVPAPVEPAAQASSAPETPGETKQLIKCAACGKEFPYMSYYKRHITRAHKDRLAELMPRE